MEKYITATAETRSKIEKTFKVGPQTVWRALRYKGKGTDTEKRIRKMALECGGITMVVAPEEETMHDADGYMRQYFPNGAMLEIDKTSGFAAIISPKGKRHSVTLIRDLAEIAPLQKVAKSL